MVVVGHEGGQIKTWDGVLRLNVMDVDIDAAASAAAAAAATVTGTIQWM